MLAIRTRIPWFSNSSMTYDKTKIDIRLGIAYFI